MGSWWHECPRKQRWRRSQRGSQKAGLGLSWKSLLRVFIGLYSEKRNQTRL